MAEWWQPKPDALDADALVPRLLGEDKEDRYNAGLALHRLGYRAQELALGLCADPRPLAREMGCFVLGRIFDPTVAVQDVIHQVYLRDGVPVLLGLLQNDPEPAVRAGAACALGFQGQLSTLPALCAAAGDPDSEVRWAVAAALGTFAYIDWDDPPPEAAAFEPEIIRTLLRLMEDEDDDVRDWATFSLHQNGHDTPEVRAAFWRALDDPNAEVRGEASYGLVRLGEPGLVPRLERLLREDPDLSPLYCEAAEELGDPALLPAVRCFAERWEGALEPGETLHSMITYAVEALERRAAEAAGEE